MMVGVVETAETVHWLASFAVFSVVFVLVSSFAKLYPTGLPPGPTPLPLVGSLIQVAGHNREKLFEEFRAKYGDVFSFYLGRRLVVVVSSYKMFKEAFVNRGRIFSNRPHIFSVDIVGQGKGVLNTSGTEWKEHRTFTVKCLRQFTFGRPSLQEMIRVEVEDLLRILDGIDGSSIDPNDFIPTAIANVICSIAFNKRFEHKDPQFKRFLEIFDENLKLIGGTSVLNFFPVLRYLPGDVFKFNKVLANVKFVRTFLRTIIEEHKSTFDGTNVRDFVDAYLKKMEENRINGIRSTMADDQLLRVIGDLFVGGTETTSTTLRWGLIFMLHHPDVQQRCRDEIDANTDSDDVVVLADRSKLPYTCATIHEIQRFGDIAPFAIVHGLSDDGQIGNYRVPKDAIVIPNIHALLFDPKVWKDPYNFRPERFLTREGKEAKYLEFVPFSMGPRKCLGENVAKTELFLIFASIIKRYLIVPPESGELPKMDGVTGITRAPLPFKVRFLRR